MTVVDFFSTLLIVIFCTIVYHIVRRVFHDWRFYPDKEMRRKVAICNDLLVMVSLMLYFIVFSGKFLVEINILLKTVITMICAILLHVFRSFFLRSFDEKTKKKEVLEGDFVFIGIMTFSIIFR